MPTCSFEVFVVLQDRKRLPSRFHPVFSTMVHEG